MTKIIQFKKKMFHWPVQTLDLKIYTLLYNIRVKNKIALLNEFNNKLQLIF